MKLLQYLKSIFKSEGREAFSQVVLFEEKRPDISICVTMSIKSDGSLEVAGRDQGQVVKKFQGKSEYEYYLLVSPKEKEELKEKLRRDEPDLKTDSDLLKWFKLHYSKNEAFSEITALLKELKVEHDTSFW